MDAAELVERRELVRHVSGALTKERGNQRTLTRETPSGNDEGATSLRYHAGVDEKMARRKLRHQILDVAANVCCVFAVRHPVLKSCDNLTNHRSWRVDVKVDAE